MPMQFEFVVDGPPVSQQTKNKIGLGQWKNSVRNAATKRWEIGTPFSGDVLVSITYFYIDSPPDVDNMTKPILDALKGLIYIDDRQVSDLVCRKRDLNSDLRIQNPSALLSTRLRGSGQFLYINIRDASSQEVSP